MLLALLGGFAFVRGTRVPLLGWIDLAIHEFGHLATSFLPEVANAVMGNGTQTLLPLGLAAAFWFRERDWLGAVVCLGWAATTLQDASVYIADAPHQRLQLIGGYHDWAFALAELGLLHRAEAIARLVWTAGLMLWIVAAAGCAAGPWIAPATSRSATAAAHRVHAAGAGDSLTGPPASRTGPAADWRDYFS